jgi:phage baseplate assembly protein W
MAFGIRRIPVLDKQPRKAIGFQIPYSSPSVFISNYQTKDALKINIINYLLTNKGERFFNINFGSSIRALLFEPITDTTADELEFRLKQELALNFPQIAVNELVVEQDSNLNTIRIYFKYQIRSIDTVDEILLNIEQ